MTTVYLIRHAEAEGNLYRRAHGQYDSMITDRGYRQIAALAKRFADVPVDAVWSSDLTRTQTTALSVTRTHGLPLRTTPRLREIGVGEWEDRTWAWLAKFDRERLLAFNTDLSRWSVRGGELISDVRDRMLGALRDIVAEAPGKTVAVFSHGMALRTLVGTLQGLSIEEIDKTGHAENTAVTKLEADGNGIRVVWRDDASHLSDALSTVRNQAWTKAKGGIEEGVWFAPDKRVEGRWEAFLGDACIGAVSVVRREGRVASAEEFRLDEAERRRGLGVRLLGQAVSGARALGCDTLRATLPRENVPALRSAAAYGFRTVCETPELVTVERYFGDDEAYRAARFDAALRETEA